MNILTFQNIRRLSDMWQRVMESLPPKNEILAVVHLIDENKEQVHEDATWDGEMWTRRYCGERVDKNYYYLWRRLET